MYCIFTRPTSKYPVPLSSIYNPLFISKVATTPFYVLAGHCGMGICISAGQLPEDLQFRYLV